MDCKTAAELLPLYFDGELDRVISREFEAHLDQCDDCRDALILLDDMRRALREDAPRYRAPETLRARIQKEATTTHPRARMPMPRLAMAASWVLAFLAGAGAFATLNHTSGSESESSQLTRDLFASHWRALAATSPIDVVSTDQHTVKPWFAGKTATAPVVRDFADQGYALIGGRIDYAGSERIPVLVYRHGKHLIDVYVLPATSPLTTQGITESRGYVLETATLDGQRVAIVSDMDHAELTHFRDLLGSSIRSD